MTTGDESAAAAKRKLKTVRSHVMKNYLQQQQRQGHSGDSSLSVATGDRRKGKQRARSSRSASREAERSPISPAVSEGARSAVAELGSLFSGLSSYSPYTGKGADEQARSSELNHH
ncbi:hypothetical protein K469DRAFT_303958 [Zopfia rhizophila CBS 207.26]|uniref:Uncharacterized protein n=1 Tax=Zopfia rhizophila CBS 207.26 TaxID=1314779 RepID=A0A6A6DI98_9PEZI|nr:hypothetical protein K469DRAFT_303958 [Zopfia rhizophila CBS 207.26]